MKFVMPNFGHESGFSESVLCLVLSTRLLSCVCVVRLSSAKHEFLSLPNAIDPLCHAQAFSSLRHVISNLRHEYELENPCIIHEKCYVACVSCLVCLIWAL